MIILSLILSLYLSASAAQAMDPFEQNQWALKNTGVAQTIDLDQVTTYRIQGRADEDLNRPTNLKKAKKKIVVAVLDTGVDVEHEDLKAVIHRKESECRALEKYRACLADKDQASTCDAKWMNLNNPEVDLDKNGYPMDCTGWDIATKKVNAAGILGSPEMMDPQGHGTHVAGIIGAIAGNGIGVSGVSSNVEILPVRVLDERPNEPVKAQQFPGQKPPTDFEPGEKGKEGFRKSLGDFITRGVIYAVRSGAQVINFSLGWPMGFDSEYLRGIIAEAQKKGVIFVAAAGNDSTRALLRPCTYPGVICVASHGPDGSISHFSNYGSGVTIAAPGANILSTYPMNIRPGRFKKTFGYEYIHGTSQASPYVAGVVAEMLAQGLSSEEIYARLVLGARPVKEKLPLLYGAPQNLKQDESREDSRVEKKWILSGLLDLQKSLQVQPQALILPVNREKTYVGWDRQSKALTIKFQFKNYWQDIAANQVSVRGDWLKPHLKAIRPQITSLGFDKTSGIWKKGEIRNLIVRTQITDSKMAEDSRIPADLDLKLELRTGSRTQMLVLESEIIVPISDQLKASPTTEVLGLQMPPLRADLISIDENFDGELRTDYLAAGLIQTPVKEQRGNHYFLMKQNAAGSYAPAGELKLKLGEDTDFAREQITTRIKWNNKDSGYILGLLVDRTKEMKDSSLLIHYLDSRFELQKTFEITNAKVKIPLKVSWQNLDGLKVPSWVGIGYDVGKKVSLWDLWENPSGQETAQTRFYFLNDQGELQAINEHQGYQFLDVLNPSLDQVQAGRVPVILGRNRGTENKPSYLYDFAVAEVVEGKVENFQKLDVAKDGYLYRNLIDTRVDQIMNLKLQKKRWVFEPSSQIFSMRRDQDAGLGTFWFGEGPMKTQRLTTLMRTAQGHQFYDAILPAYRGIVDANLQVRMAFWGETGLGVFSLTNSEIQFHDLSQKQALVRSFERYTFIPSMAFSEVHYPIAVDDMESSLWQHPGLITTEGSLINPGVKIKMVIRDEKKNLVEIAAPAKLRFESGDGCRSLDQATYFKDGTRAMDFYCGDKILRLKLVY